MSNKSGPVAPAPGVEPTLKRRSYYATPDDDQAVALIRQKYGLSTDSDAVRFALRLVGSEEALKWTMVPRSTRRIVIRLKSPAAGPGSSSSS